MAQSSPAQFGAIPVGKPSFNASQFGATPVNQANQPQNNSNPFGTSTVADPSFQATPQTNPDGTLTNPFGAPSSGHPSDQGVTPYGTKDLSANMANAIVNTGIGVGKQVAQLPFDVASLGKNIANGVGGAAGAVGNALGIPAAGNAVKGFLSTPNGSPFDKSTQIPSVLQDKGTAQSVGNAIAQIGEFFIPGGAEKAATEGASSLIDGLDFGKIADSLGEKSANVIKNVLKIASAGAVTGTSMGGISAVQSGGSAGSTITGAVAGGLAGSAAKALEIVSPTLLKSVIKDGFKATPTQEIKASQKLEDASQFMASNKIIGSESTKYTKLSGLTSNLETTLQNAVPDLRINKQSIIDGINANVETLAKEDPAVYQSARNTADSAIKTLQKDDSPTITADQALKGKRSWGQAAFKATKGVVKDPNVTSEGAYATELAYQQAFEGSLQRVGGKISLPSNLQPFFGGAKEVSYGDFNSVYSKAITSKNLTMIASARKDSALIGRLFGLWAGSAVGETIMPGLGGKILGGTIGEIGSSHLPSLGRGIAEQALGLPNSTIPNVTKVGLGLGNSPSNQ